MSTTGGPGLAMVLAQLRRELKRKEITVRQLAERIGVSEPTAWRWLRGDGLTLDRLDRICNEADLDFRDLLGRRDGDEQADFTLAQERVLAADRGLALVFFAILHGAQPQEIVETFALPPERLDGHLERLRRLHLVTGSAGGRLRATVRRTVRWRRGGPLATAFERTVKPLFMSMDFGSVEAQYVSDVVPLTAVGRARVQALFERLRDDIQLIGEQERAAGLAGRDWSGLLMMIRPFELAEMTEEWRRSAENHGMHAPGTGEAAPEEE